MIWVTLIGISSDRRSTVLGGDGKRAEYASGVGRCGSLLAAVRVGFGGSSSCDAFRNLHGTDCAGGRVGRAQIKRVKAAFPEPIHETGAEAIKCYLAVPVAAVTRSTGSLAFAPSPQGDILRDFQNLQPFRSG